MKEKYKKFWHKVFKFSIILKGLDGVLDLVSGWFLFFATTNPITRVAPFLFRQELIEDPEDRIANWLVGVSQNIAPETATFIALYLLIHGLVKISLSLALFSKNYHAYKIAGIILTILVGYQFYRFSHTHSVALLLVTLYDLIILAMVYNEAKNLKANSLKIIK